MGPSLDSTSNCNGEKFQFKFYEAQVVLLSCAYQTGPRFGGVSASGKRSASQPSDPLVCLLESLPSLALDDTMVVCDDHMILLIQDRKGLEGYMKKRTV